MSPFRSTWIFFSRIHCPRLESVNEVADRTALLIANPEILFRVYGVWLCLALDRPYRYKDYASNRQYSGTLSGLPNCGAL
jgi:hypothetical protein